MEKLLAGGQWHMFGHPLVRIPQHGVRARGFVHGEVRREDDTVDTELLNGVHIDRGQALGNLRRAWWHWTVVPLVRSK